MATSSSSSSDTMLVEKMERLLCDDTAQQQHHQQHQHAPERRLVVLVLLTRLQDPEQFTVIWETHPSLVAFCIQLLQDTVDDNEENASATPELLAAVYTRLIAQLLSRMSPDRLGETIINPLTKALLAVLDRRRRCGLPLDAADVEVANSLNVWFEMKQQETGMVNAVDKALTVLYERYQSMLQASSTAKEAGVGESKNGLDSSQAAMFETLTALLDNGLSPDDDSGSDLHQSWEIESIALFLQYGMVVSETMVPSFWLPALQWWIQVNVDSKKSKSKGSTTGATRTKMNLDMRRSWAQVLLLCARNMSNVASFRDQLVQASSTILAQSVTRLLMTCVVSMQDDSDRLRSIAWSTGATLVEACGWEWLILAASTTSSDTKESSLGLAFNICALIRLAVGEWKIQLGLLVAEDRGPSKERLVLVQACSQVIVQAVNFVVDLADRMDAASDTETLPLSADALIHLRKSLEEGLNLAVQYLGLAERREPSVDLPVVRVLGALLTEFDVFEQQVATKEKDGNEILQALRVALDIHNVECQEHLLPSLAAVFASGQGEELKVAMFEDYELLDDPLVGFLETYWNQTTSLASIQSACHVIELWTSMVRLSDTSGLLQCIVDWIERNLDTPSPTAQTSELKTVLSTAVACFVTLQGDERPGELHATILQRALEFCAGN